MPPIPCRSTDLSFYYTVNSTVLASWVLRRRLPAGCVGGAVMLGYLPGIHRSKSGKDQLRHPLPVLTPVTVRSGTLHWPGREARDEGTGTRETKRRDERRTCGRQKTEGRKTDNNARINPQKRPKGPQTHTHPLELAPHSSGCPLPKGLSR